MGVLTNAPPFDDQMRRLADFMQLSSQPPRNLLSDSVDLTPYSRGMGAMGLPGDLSSQSRFVRASFTKLNALPGGREQFFHILDTVRQTRVCCRMADGAMEYTLYSSCCDMEKRIYCCTTWGSRRISGIDMNREDLSGIALRRWPLMTREDILLQN